VQRRQSATSCGCRSLPQIVVGPVPARSARLWDDGVLEATCPAGLHSHGNRRTPDGQDWVAERREFELTGDFWNFQASAPSFGIGTESSSQILCMRLRPFWRADPRDHSGKRSRAA